MRALALALLLAVAGCGPDPAPAVPERPASTPDVEAPPATERPDAAPPDGAPEAAPAERPATVEETVVVEGMDETVTLRLATFRDVPLPFSTYIYDMWESDVVASGEGTAVRFATGAPPFEATLTLFVPSGNPPQDDVAGLARAAAESYGDVQELEVPPAWVRVGYAFRDGETVGTVQVGEHAGTFFYIVEAFPVEMGDGFGPASAVALDRLRWLDDGTGL